MRKRLSNDWELDILPNEQWRVIDYVDCKSGKEVVDEKLMVSSYGRVLSIKSEVPNLIKPVVQNAGYQIIKVNGTWKTLHRIIAHLFLEPIEGKNEVDHIDGNKFNNHISNLQWIKHRENLQKKVSAKLRKKDMVIDRSLMSEEHKNDKCSVYMLDINGNLIEKFNSVKSAALATNSSSQMISECVNGNRLIYRGHMWISDLGLLIGLMKVIKSEVIDKNKCAYHIYNNKQFNMDIYNNLN